MLTLAQSAASTTAVPLSTDWAPALLLTILWIFAAAALAGCILRFFHLDKPFREN